MHSSPQPTSAAPLRRLRAVVRGAVQGVGFRPFVYRLATEMDLPGWVINSAQGVFIEVEAQEPRLREFLRRLETEKPAIAHIQSLEASFLDPAGFTGFEIRESSGGAKTALILPDLATCPDCLRDIGDPANRRYRYPFTNCTNCGPRFTIIESLPYDRPRTTMKRFVMCAACAREYHDPRDRRFHAQPNACPECGPHLELWSAAAAPVNVLATHDAALLAAAAAIREGKIVAVKGLGGFHLMCDARNDAAVGELRRRKRREEKPLAVMFPALPAVLAACECSPVELRLLRSPESPIVLLRRKTHICQNRADVGHQFTVSQPHVAHLNVAQPPSAGHASAPSLAPSLAPGNPNLGVLLPYTPLHHLLLQELGFPVVATSGNLSEEPICTDEHEAIERLRAIADLFLVHNRPILRHVDDSIAREMAGRELLLRRARGFAPLPVYLTAEAPTIVAVGAQQKNAIASSVGAQVFVSQHIGDLESAPSLDAFTAVNAAFRELYELQPAALACDLHPDYLSTQYAQRAAQAGAPAPQDHVAQPGKNDVAQFEKKDVAQPPPAGAARLIGVQHHYAHVLACMAENQLRPPVLGIAWDGSGFGPDGTIWGGEFLRINHVAQPNVAQPPSAGQAHPRTPLPLGYERVAHLRTFGLPGGEKAVKEPRRVALAVLYEIFGEAAFALDSPALRAFRAEELRVLAAMLRQGIHAPRTSSAGRLFDAVAALAGLRQRCGFEGQAAMELEFAADAFAPAASTLALEPYPFTLRDGAPLVLDWEPMLRAIVEDTRVPHPERSEGCGCIASRFHLTLARMMVAVAERLGVPQVALSGGCFQNRLLTELVIRHMTDAGFQAYWHQRIPPNDGGIALGQIVAAAAQLKLES